MSNNAKLDPVEAIIQDETLGMGEKLLKVGCPPEKIDAILEALNKLREISGREVHYPKNLAMSHPEGREHIGEYYQQRTNTRNIVADDNVDRVVMAEIYNIQAHYFGEQYRPRYL